MSDTPAPPRWAECPQCGERLGVRAESAGKKGRCAKCGKVFVITLQAVAAKAPTKPKAPAPVDFSSPPPARSASVTFSCELCGTRISVRSADVGKSIRCPDCNRKNIIPEPAAPAGPRIPAAMLGEQYELWGIDEVPAPAPTKSTVRTQQRHPVHCTRCRTLMYARDDQIGTKLKCPDCGSLTVARPREADRPAGPVLVPAGKEYQVDRDSGIVKPFAPTPLTPQEAEMQALSQMSSVASAMAAHKNRVIEPPKQRPKRPRNPLLQGVWPMMFTEELLARWIALSLLAGVAGELAAESLFSPIQGQAEAIKIVMAAIGAFVVGIWATMAGPLMVTIVAESSDGNDKLNEPPTWLAFDWFGEFFTILFAASTTGLAGLGAWKLAQLAAAPAFVQEIVPAAVILLVLPVTILSALLEGSPFAVISPRVIASLGRCAGLWFLFYLESFLIAAAVAGAVWTLRESGSLAVWAGAAAILAGLMLEMRLLGRLAWWISESMPEKEEKHA